MAGGIKGITVKIGGDTTELGRSLSNATKQSTALQKELKGVNTLLKFDPKNVTLLAQKSDLLKKSIGETETKLKSLKEVLAKADSGEIKLTEEEYRHLQREIVNTENKLKGLKEAQKDFGSVGAQQIAQVGEKLKDIGGKFEDAGKKMLPLTGIITGIGTVAVTTTANFDKSMSNVSAISGATGKDLDALRAKAREMGSQTKFSASESADAMSYMAMAGWKTEDMLNGVSGVMDLASASGEDLAKTSDILTDGLTAFGLSAKDSGRMADVMASASSNANTNVSLLGESYKYCASTAGAMGFSLEDVTESLGLMANAGVKGSQAGTTLKNAMINLAKPTDAMQAVMDKYNISLTNTDGSMKSWNQIVDDLRANLGGLSEDQQTSAVATLFGKEATAGMLSVINAAPADVKKLNNAINNSTGSAKEMANTMNDNLSGQLTILKSQLEELAISFGEMLMPMIRGVVTAIQGFVDKLNSMSETQRTVILVILAVVASIGPLLIIIGKIIFAVGQIMTLAPAIMSAITAIKAGVASLSATLMANPIGIVIALVVALVGALIYAYNHSEKFREIVNGAFQSVKDFVGNVVSALVTFFTETIPNGIQALKDKITPILEAIKTFFSTVWNGIKTVVSTVVNAIKTILLVGFALIMNLLVPIINGFLTLFKTVWNGIKTAISTVINFVKPLIINAWTAIKNTITPIINGIKTVITTVWNAIKSVTTSVWNGIKSGISTAIHAVSSVITPVVNTIKNTITSVWNGIKSVTTTVWNGIKHAIINPIKSAWDTVKGVIDTIKNAVKNIFKGIVPKLHLSLPKISVSGGEAPFGIAGKGKLPSFSVKWNKLGAIFNKPTIFSTDQGFQGVGEAGPEAVAPIDVLQKYVAEAVDNRNVNLERKLDQVIGLMANYYPDALRAMDRPVIVGIDSVDSALSDKSSKVSRGW